MGFRLFFIIAGCWLMFSSCSSSDQDQGPITKSQQDMSADTAAVDGTIRYSDDAITGQTVYVPVYSHIYQQNRAKTFNLTATLSIRNTSIIDSLEVNSVQYYDSDGKLVRNYLSSTQTLGPLSSIAYVIDEDDLTGGIGANFIVRWSAPTEISKPIIEAVMISTSHQQGISFTGAGRVIDEL